MNPLTVVITVTNINSVPVADAGDDDIIDEGTVYMLDGKVGFINVSGKMAIEPNYISVGYFSNGLAWAKNSDKQLGYINKNGEWGIEAKFAAGKNW